MDINSVAMTMTDLDYIASELRHHSFWGQREAWKLHSDYTEKLHQIIMVLTEELQELQKRLHKLEDIAVTRIPADVDLEL